MAKLTAVRIASLVQSRDALPDPIGLTVGRAGYLTLVFDDRDAMLAWRAQLSDVEPVPHSTWNSRESYRGTMQAEDRGGQFEIPTTLTYRPPM